MSLTQSKLLDRIDELAAENAALRSTVRQHPAVETLKFIGPFVRDCIAAGVWTPGPGTEAVEREMASMLSWAERR